MDVTDDGTDARSVIQRRIDALITEIDSLHAITDDDPTTSVGIRLAGQKEQTRTELRRQLAAMNQDVDATSNRSGEDTATGRP